MIKNSNRVRWSFILYVWTCFIFSLTACQSVEGLNSGSGYIVKVQVYNSVESVAALLVKINGITIKGGHSISMPRKFSGKPHGEVGVTVISTSLNQADRRYKFNLNDMLPSEFGKLRTDSIIFDVNANAEPEIYFDMKLSELTTKRLKRTESLIEKKQRSLDELLLVGIIDGDEKKVLMALSQGASLVQPWVSLAGGYRDGALLDFAIKYGNAQIIKSLFESGLDNMNDKEGFSILLNPLYERNNQLLRVLLENGANPNNRAYLIYKKDGNRIVEKARKSERALVVAVFLKDEDMIKTLLEHGANVDFTVQNKPRQNFLEWARVNATSEILSLINLYVKGKK